MSYDDDDDYNDNTYPQNDDDTSGYGAAGPQGSDGYDEQGDDNNRYDDGQDDYNETSHDPESDFAQDDQDTNWPQDSQDGDQDQDPGVRVSDNEDDRTDRGEIADGREHYYSSEGDDLAGSEEDPDGGAFDGQQAYDDDNTATHHFDVNLNVGSSGYGQDDQSPTLSRGMHGGDMYASPPGAVVQGGGNQYYAQGGANYPTPAAGWYEGGTAHTPQSYGQQGGWGGPPANPAQSYAPAPHSYSPPADNGSAAPAASSKQHVNASSSSKKNSDDDDKAANKPHGFVDGVLSQASGAIQTGIGKGIANSAAQATEGLIKMVGSSLHIGTKKPTAQLPATPAASATSHHSRPSPASAKPRPSQASVPSGAASGTGPGPVPQSSGPRPVAGARPTGNRPPATGTARPSPATQSGQGGAPSPAHSSIPPASGRTQANGNAANGAPRRPEVAHAGGQTPVRTAVRGDQNK
ncbi:hypothetical protein L227DRAFT_599725 [Lentinus tigrinus ALCF2SS1-6]|uniref:Uncharacterized protein n=1 Tax=Lentinus tigrinus ALCF2SS1-6 TaxID=1328759 RepID=A0A5C2SGL8_9APHY|nr:hypothetical protein L227DRAFT_599725 [Lentinus tigrinus ALCF2SS1-6]